MPLTNDPPGTAKDLLKTAKRLVLVGANGVGMYGMARAALSRGRTVSGCDRHVGEFAARLCALGCEITEGERPSLRSGDLLIYTAALAPDHPALAEAARRKIPCLSRAEALAALTEDLRPCICVAGTHGKSTTTALLGHLLTDAGRDPTMICGAVPVREGDPYRSGQGSAVLECCEYKRSFLSFSPDTAVVLNVDWDHTDCYPTVAELRAAFCAFVARSRAAVLPAEDADLLRTAEEHGVPCLTFSLDTPRADVTAVEVESEGGRYRMTVLVRGRRFCRAALALPGRYNLANALAASAAAVMLGVPPETVEKALSAEEGVRRRMEYKKMWQGARVYEDYAHHPAEIAASLTAAREMTTAGRLFCVFQSHTYTRTSAHLTAIGAALSLADRCLILPIYAARETDTLGMSAAVIAAQTGPCAVAVPDFQEAVGTLSAELRAGDTLVVMGAGDVHDLFALIP